MRFAYTMLRYWMTWNSCCYLAVRGDEPECLGDLLRRGTTAHVQEVGGLASVQLDDIHGGHRQTSTVHCRHGRDGDYM